MDFGNKQEVLRYVYETLGHGKHLEIPSAGEAESGDGTSLGLRLAEDGGMGNDEALAPTVAQQNALIMTQKLLWEEKRRESFMDMIEFSQDEIKELEQAIEKAHGSPVPAGLPRSKPPSRRGSLADSGGSRKLHSRQSSLAGSVGGTRPAPRDLRRASFIAGKLPSMDLGAEGIADVLGVLSECDMSSLDGFDPPPPDLLRRSSVNLEDDARKIRRSMVELTLGEDERNTISELASSSENNRD